MVKALQDEKSKDEGTKDTLQKELIFLKTIKSCCFWISKLLYLDFQILLSIEVVTRLSHDQVALFKTFRGTTQNCARQTINHAASKIKQVQLQLFD